MGRDVCSTNSSGECERKSRSRSSTQQHWISCCAGNSPGKTGPGGIQASSNSVWRPWSIILERSVFRTLVIAGGRSTMAPTRRPQRCHSADLAPVIPKGNCWNAIQHNPRFIFSANLWRLHLAGVAARYQRTSSVRCQAKIFESTRGAETFG